MTSVANRQAESAATATEGISPAAILELASGFRAAKFLMAASELGVFESLADGPADIDALATRTGLTRRTARICADAMVAVGLLERDGDTYRNTAPAATYLAGGSSVDLRPFIHYSDRISYPAWTDLARALRQGPTGHLITDLDPERQRLFSEGVEAVNAGSAAALVATADFTACHRLLDIGGGTGSWAIAVVRAHPHVTGTVFELPQVADIARQRISAQGLSGRIEVAAGDINTAEFPAGYDCCLLANVIHCFSPEDNQRLLAKARRAVTPGARMFLADYWTNPTHTEPVIAALMAGEYAVNIEHGDVYSLAEGLEWLTCTGWRFIAHDQLADAKSLITAEAI